MVRKHFINCQTQSHSPEINKEGILIIIWNGLRSLAIVIRQENKRNCRWWQWRDKAIIAHTWDKCIDAYISNASNYRNFSNL